MILGLLSNFPLGVSADEAPDPIHKSSDSLPIQFRRVFVPADKMEAWPRDGEKLIPIESRDFDEWIRAWNDAAGQTNQVSISTAEYTAHLDNDGRLRGHGQWTIVAHGEKPTFLALSDLSLVLQNPHWENAPKQPARIGMWGQNNHAPGRFGLEVVRSGTLKFDWHAPTRSADDQIDIPWLVPAANSARLTLDLPEGKQARIEGGVVLESTVRRSDDKSAGKPLLRWVIGLSPVPAATLRIVSADGKSSQLDSQTVFHEEVSYHIGPRGLDLTALWLLDGPADPKRELAIAVPPALQLSSIQADGRDAAWRLIRDPSSPSDTAVVDLPKSDNAKPTQIKLKAWQPVVVNQPWRMPRLRPEGVFWSSGKFELSVAASHELKRLNPIDCIETATEQLTASEDSPETHSFTAYRSPAAIEIDLSERQTDATIRAGSSLTLADPNLNGRLVTQWNVSHGAAHQLVGKLAPGWIVEALETIPADAMAEWFIDRHGNDQQIEIQLSRAATATRNVTVIVTARLQRFNLTEPISAETMKMVKWNGAESVLHLLTFQSNESYTVVPVGKLPEVAVDSVDTNDRELLDQAIDNRIFDITEAGKNAGVQLTIRRGQFAARIDVETTYENEILRHGYRIVAEPKSGLIDRLLVCSTNPLGDSIRWIDKSTNTPIAAEKLAGNDPRRANLPKDGEVWLLQFSQPTSRPVEITASITNKRPDRSPIPLLFLPEAAQQDARITVRCRNRNALWLQPSHLQTVPLPPHDAASNEVNESPPLCAAYRYQPADCRDPVKTPKLSASAVSESKTIPLMARHIRLESFVWPDGSGAHCTTYELDNHGATVLKLDLPSGARLVSASLDGHSFDVAKPINNGQSTLIRLPAQSRSTRLSLYLDTNNPPLAAGRQLAAPIVLDQLPFIAGDWTVWLPEEYSASGAGLVDAAPEFNWRERMFGIFGRPAGSRPFNPFRLADGAALVNGLADGNVTGSPANESQDQTQITSPSGNALVPAGPAESVDMPTAGWRPYHESFIAGGPAPITVNHPPAIAAWAVSLLLASFLCGRWLRRVRAEAFVVVLAAAAASALLLPFAFANLASGVVIGLLLSLFPERPRHSVVVNDSVGQPRFSSATTVAIAVLFAACLAKLTLAVSPQSATADRDLTNKIYRVMIPTDAQGHHAGTKYFVSDQFLRVLTSAASDSNQTSAQWLLSDATFSGELTERPEKKEINAGNWTLTYSIETLSRDTAVVLPLVRGEADWSSTAMLDGVPLPIDWRDAGRTCAIEIPEPGRYSLSISCVPKTTTIEGHNQIDLAVPTVLGAKIVVRYPEAVAGVTIERASVLPPPATPSNTLRAELGRTNRLKFQWSFNDKSENGTGRFGITELRWLDVKPAELETTIKYVLEGGARRPDSITVTYDDRWKLLTSEKSLNAEPSADSAGQHVLRIPLPIQSADRQELSLRWRLTNPPPMGNLRLPPIELSSTPPAKRWLAISNDPALDCELSDASATDATVNEFLAKWGDAEPNDPPDWVLSNFEPRRSSNLAIRPRETEQIVDESLSVSAGLTALRANYEAILTPGLAGANRIELSAPANLSISGITVAEDDRPVPIRWSRSSKNRVNVFFGQQLTKPYRLVLDGTTPADPDNKATLPRISTVATEDATQKTRLYRDDDVQLDIEGLSAKNDPKAAPPGPPPAEWSVRPVGICYLESDSTSSPRLSMKPNKLKMSGDSLTTLARESGAWWANYRCQLIVEDGNLDILRLRLPANFAGPFDVQSAEPVTTEFKSAAGQTGILSVRFAETIAKGGSVDLRIHSPLSPTTGTQVSAPAITLELLASVHRYISVPESADLHAISWTETGVRPAALPPKLRPTSAPPTLTRFFEIVADPFQIASRPPASPDLAPQIRLADIAIVAGDFGTQRITTRLILAPHGLTDCTLKLPPNQTLVSAELDGRPAMIRQLDPSQWQLTLGAPNLPQSLQIVSRSASGRAAERLTDLERPTLLANGQPIPAEMSLWSFAHPQKFVSPVVTGADQVTAVEQAALRFDRLVSIAETAKATAAELSPPDGYNWFGPWAKLLTAVRAETQHTNTAPPAERVESQVTHTSEEQITQAAARLDKWLDDCRKTLISPDPQRPPAPPASDNLPVSGDRAVPAAGEWTYYVAEGGNDRLELHFRSFGPTPTQSRLTGLLIIAGSLIGALWLMRRPAAADFLYRWPNACGVLLGIAIWAWMWPSWLGILVAAANLWLALRFAWPGRSLRTEASTVLRRWRTT